MFTLHHGTVMPSTYRPMVLAAKATQVFIILSSLALSSFPGAYFTLLLFLGLSPDNTRLIPFQRFFEMGSATPRSQDFS